MIHEGSDQITDAAEKANGGSPFNAEKANGGSPFNAEKANGGSEKGERPFAHKSLREIFEIPSLPPNAARAESALPADDATARPEHADDAFNRFEAVWTFTPSESVKAARNAFQQLTAADREAAIQAAPTFQASQALRMHPMHAATFIRERKWTFSRTPTAAPAAQARIMARQLADGRWQLHPDSAQLLAHREFERRTEGQARLGCVRSSEWPPGASAPPEAVAVGMEHAP